MQGAADAALGLSVDAEAPAASARAALAAALRRLPPRSGAACVAGKGDCATAEAAGGRRLSAAKRGELRSRPTPPPTTTAAAATTCAGAGLFHDLCHDTSDEGEDEDGG